MSLATVAHTFESFYLYGAIEPTTGASFFLQLPGLNTALFQLWLDHFAQAFPESFNLLVLDNGAFHKAKAVQWPAHVVPVFLPPTARNSIRLSACGGTSRTSWPTV